MKNQSGKTVDTHIFLGDKPNEARLPWNKIPLGAHKRGNPDYPESNTTTPFLMPAQTKRLAGALLYFVEQLGNLQFF